MNQQPLGRDSSKAAGDSTEWTLADLIDLEVLVNEDAESSALDAATLRQRDRRIYSECPVADGKTPDRRHAFHVWLDARRKERFRAKVSIGEEFLSTIFWVRITLFVTGMLLARAAVWSFFRGAELSAPKPEPINVLWFGCVCIALPFLVTLYGGWVLLGQKAAPSLPRAPAFLRGTLFSLLQPLLRVAIHRASEGLGPEHRLSAQSLIGALKQRVDSRRTAISAKIFHLIQAFGVAFTLGILVFSWLDCKFNSRVFGWQTTDRRMTAGSVYGTVKILALPWSWLQSDGLGYPSLTQVAQTNFVRFRDPALFPPEAAPAWAAFLIWSALIYGFLPRLLLARMSARAVHTALRAEDFEELRFDPLWERMTLQRGTFQPPESDSIAQLPDLAAQFTNAPDTAPSAYRIIIPSELHTPDRATAVTEWLRTQKGWSASAIEPLDPGLAQKQRLTANLTKFAAENSRVKILIIHESFMPPAQEFLDFLAETRKALGPKSAIYIGLLGKPDGTPLAAPPKQLETAIWKRKVITLGDPNMEVFPFLAPE